MDSPANLSRRYFVSYSGVTLPLKFVNEIDKRGTENRNTYFCADYDESQTMVACEKRVYGEVEFSHRYDYYPSGKLKTAYITMLDDDEQQLDFDE